MINGACNPSTEFACANGDCIDRIKVSNGVTDCADNSEEVNYVCSPVPKFQCTSDTTCLPISFVGDGNKDCPDSSDERKIIGQNCDISPNCAGCDCADFVANSECTGTPKVCQCVAGRKPNSLKTQCNLSKLLKIK